MTDMIQAIENAEARSEEFKAEIAKPAILESGVKYVTMQRHEVTCTACGEKVDAVVEDGVVRGWCATAGKKVEMSI